MSMILSLLKSSVFCLMRRRTPRATLFPYTTLFRSSQMEGFQTTPVFIDLDHILEEKLLLWKNMAEAKNVTLRRSEEHTSELQSRENIVCRLLLEKKKRK